jgi:hypothetical protein
LCHVIYLSYHANIYYFFLLRTFFPYRSSFFYASSSLSCFLKE